MLCTSELDMAETVKPSDIDVFLSDAAWAVCSTYHTVLNSLTAKSVLAGEETCSYILNFYVGIVHYILHETKTQRAKIYLPTQRTNRQILTSAKKI
jgi:hypothetical protein